MEVVLNVYDLMDSERPYWIKNMNWYMYSMGLGLYHSAIELNGREFAFGGHDMPGTGVFENEPRRAEGAIFREAIPLGQTQYTLEESESIIAELSLEYTGISYRLFNRNCNHFAEDLGFRLTGNRAPLWINRLASYGDSLKAWLPEGTDSPHLAPVNAPQQNLPPASTDDYSQDLARDTDAPNGYTVNRIMYNK